jgi:hypothetical protein
MDAGRCGDRWAGDLVAPANVTIGGGASTPAVIPKAYEGAPPTRVGLGWVLVVAAMTSGVTGTCSGVGQQKLGGTERASPGH